MMPRAGIVPALTHLRVLLVDDSEETVLIASKLLRKMGHVPIVARSGAEALRQYVAERPDLVLMDVVMPEMDGYQAAAHLKAISVNRWVPLVFLTAKTEDAAVARGIEVGGDDYLLKPISFVTLKAKLDAFARMLQMQRQLEQKSAELEVYYRAAEDEQRVAGHLMSQLVRSDMLRDPLLAHWIEPAHNLSGDLVAAARTPGGVLHVLLADGTGHGLAASLNVLPAVDPFYAMTARGYGIGTIAREINAKLKLWLPVERFVAATLVSFDPRERMVEVWSGGNPPPFLLDPRGRIVHEFSNMHLPLGVLAQSDFDSRTERLQADSDCQLVLCSDGAIEAQNADGSQFGRAGLIDTLRSAPAEGRLDCLKRALGGHFDGHPAHDDIAVAIINCVKESARQLRLAAPAAMAADAATPGDAAAASGADGEWSMRARFTATELKYLDLVPTLLGLLQKLHGAQPHSAQLFVVLSELFNNALDHGLLRLDSALKRGPDGMERFLEIRQRRLDELRDASIEIGLESITLGNRPMLKIWVKDSGTGFDHKPAPATAGAATRAHGRGIELVKGLCAAVEYHGCGNTVSAWYHLTQPERVQAAALRPQSAAVRRHA
jgi:CheY-like chemotaxis protein/anti-sigma regulatory factor (Ser/Thr protein kinase)